MAIFPTQLLPPAAVTALCLGISTQVSATAPCGDFGECKTLIEINASDGDIGFHFLIDGEDLNSVRLENPDGAKVFEDIAKGALAEQKLTETFAESSEPLCWPDPEADPDDEIVSLEEFLERWQAGTYTFIGKGDEGEKLEGETELSYALPAAPTNLDYSGGLISWSSGDDLGNCGSFAQLSALVDDGVLPVHPVNVVIAIWEVVLEAEDGSGLKFSIRLPASQMSVTVPTEYLNTLADDTLAKIEVGAITADDNATFTELGDICLNEVEGCEEGEE
ncbi:hypothetical protein GCM10011352_28560 [Marinobacterium zhoushanense]|uniref:Uncharacterized protein n=1 Tax=Marinobacterium zhoushanense TaxID=1679163 RepID=A0ABQ1KMR4_9GAMM|nr:hypothetical protein [Marinobacterium zhoushanense]GGC00692.1 hypothetical protein GCM10011352_28560 [Marinobacterium zhoushanense]